MYEEVGTLTTLKEIPLEKERHSELNIKEVKDPSTMDSCRLIKERSQ